MLVKGGQGYPSHPREISKSDDTPFALFCNAELDPSAFPSILSEGKLPKEFSWITEGQVGGMAYPDKQEYFRFLANQNVKYVVSLTEQPASAIAVPGEHLGALRWRHTASWRLKSRVSWMSVQQLVEQTEKHQSPLLALCGGVLRTSNAERVSKSWRHHHGMPWAMFEARPLIAYEFPHAACRAKFVKNWRMLHYAICGRWDYEVLHFALMDWYKIAAGLHGLPHVPLVRYVKLRVAHAPGMPGTFSPPPTSKETAS